MSLARKGKTFTEEHCRKISEAQSGEKGNNYGKHPSEATRHKMSEGNKGRIPVNLGGHHSEEAIRKIREARKGKTPSKGKKWKWSETHRENWYASRCKRLLCTPVLLTCKAISCRVRGKAA